MRRKLNAWMGGAAPVINAVQVMNAVINQKAATREIAAPKINAKSMKIVVTKRKTALMGNAAP
tara:strand:- start:387 stop:575 length:189 start_codon:yes stop_codon:yes gene_type:complete